MDLSDSSVAFAKIWTQGFPDVRIHQSHSHDFLRNWNGPKIDCLYLDSADVWTEGYQECCLEEAKIGLPLLADRGLILIDDSPWDSCSWTGKGTTAIPWLLAHGCEILYAGYQVLLRRR